MATNRLTRGQFVVALTLPALLRTSGVGAQTGRTTLSLATAGPGSAFLGFARVAPVVAKRVPDDLDIRQANGSSENTELVNSGQVPIATLNLGPGYDAWKGRGQFAGRTLRDIRGDTYVRNTIPDHCPEKGGYRRPTRPRPQACRCRPRARTRRRLLPRFSRRAAVETNRRHRLARRPRAEAARSRDRRVLVRRRTAKPAVRGDRLHRVAAWEGQRKSAT